LEDQISPVVLYSFVSVEEWVAHGQPKVQKHDHICGRLDPKSEKSKVVSKCIILEPILPLVLDILQGMSGHISGQQAVLSGRLEKLECHGVRETSDPKPGVGVLSQLFVDEHEESNKAEEEARYHGADVCGKVGIERRIALAINQTFEALDAIEIDQVSVGLAEGSFTASHQSDFLVTHYSVALDELCGA
jgi:hypothetical protein